jgi:riboflavin synthase
MFTGLVVATGSIHTIEAYQPQILNNATEDTQACGGLLLTVLAPNALLQPLSLGASIALDGACTTVIAFVEEDGTTQANDTPDRRAGFCIQASPETFDKTIMGQYQVGTPINLELPLTLHAPLGGHFVTGHVDGVGHVVSRVSNGLSWVYRFRVDTPELAALLVEKGSVTINGVSLTVNTVIGDVFSVAIIPHTFTHTTLGQLNTNDGVNIETDLLGKYVQRLLTVGQVPVAVASPGSAGSAGQAMPNTYVAHPNIHTGRLV